MTAKETTQEILSQILDQLPDDCTPEDVEYHLYVRRKLLEADAAFEQGRWHSHEEVKQMLSKWLKT